MLLQTDENTMEALSGCPSQHLPKTQQQASLKLRQLQWSGRRLHLPDESGSLP
jgi:hypothetical protein